jgi:hypothetical protein
MSMSDDTIEALDGTKPEAVPGFHFIESVSLLLFCEANLQPTEH